VMVRGEIAEADVGSDSLPFAALAKREGVSPSYFTRPPFATAKPDARLIKLLIRAHRFNTALAGDPPMCLSPKAVRLSGSTPRRASAQLPRALHP
jgi:hypothetical protein